MNKNLNIDHIRRIVQKELRKIDQNNYRSGTILRIEVDCEEVDIEGWISAQDFDEKLIWSDRKRNLHIGAIGSVDKLYTTASAQFTQVYRQIEKKLSQTPENKWLIIIKALTLIELSRLIEAEQLLTNLKKQGLFPAQIEFIIERLNILYDILKNKNIKKMISIFENNK